MMDISGGFDRRNNEHIYAEFHKLDQKLTVKIEHLENSHLKTREDLRDLKLQMNIVVFFAKIIAGLITTALVGGWIILLRM